MVRDRYLSHELGRTDDRLSKIRGITNMLRKSFNDAFHPFQKLCLNNSLLYKGRLSFKQYIPMKRNRFGIKSYMLCDCRTGYVERGAKTHTSMHLLHSMYMSVA